MAEVTKSEAARLAGVTRQTIHRKVKSGGLSAIRGKIDTSELIRVFGSISDGTVTPKLQPDAAVQTTLQAKVDGLESQLAVTREQLADTSKDRDEWRDIAKEATSNVKLITDQRSTPRNNDNMMIFIGLAFLIGIGVTYTMLRNDVTADRPLPAPVETQSEALRTYPEAINVFGQPCRENNPMWEELGCPKPEQGADATPELQADTASIVTDPELIEDLRYLQAKKVKTMWTIGMNERPEQVKSLEQTAEEKGIDLSLLQSINITDKDIADYWDSFDP